MNCSLELHDGIIVPNSPHATPQPLLLYQPVHSRLPPSIANSNLSLALSIPLLLLQKNTSLESPQTNLAIVNVSLAGTRLHIGKDKHHLPLAPLQLHGNLWFTSKKEKEKYTIVLSLPIVQGKTLHASTVQKLNLNVDVLFENIGWVNFFIINCPIYYELIWEFYSTFSTTLLIGCTLDTVDVIKFRLLDQRFTYLLIEFNKALGLIDDESAQFEAYLNVYIDICNNFNPQSMHKMLTHQPPAPFNSSKSSDSYLHSPALIFIYRLLVYSFLGRKDSFEILFKTELFIL